MAGWCSVFYEFHIDRYSGLVFYCRLGAANVIVGVLSFSIWLITICGSAQM